VGPYHARPSARPAVALAAKRRHLLQRSHCTQQLRARLAGATSAPRPEQLASSFLVRRRVLLTHRHCANIYLARPPRAPPRMPAQPAPEPLGDSRCLPCAEITCVFPGSTANVSGGRPYPPALCLTRGLAPYPCMRSNGSAPDTQGTQGTEPLWCSATGPPGAAMVCHLALLDCSPAADLLAGGEAEAPPTVRGPEAVDLLLGALQPGSPVPTETWCRAGPASLAGCLVLAVAAVALCECQVGSCGPVLALGAGAPRAAQRSGLRSSRSTQARAQERLSACHGKLWGCPGLDCRRRAWRGALMGSAPLRSSQSSRKWLSDFRQHKAWLVLQWRGVSWVSSVLSHTSAPRFARWGPRRRLAAQHPPAPRQRAGVLRPRARRASARTCTTAARPRRARPPLRRCRSTCSCRSSAT